jgi:signal transduction histidine kinase
MVGDPARLGQVLINLMDNAVKFTEAGGVDLRVGREGESVSFSVQDTGIGIPEEKMQMVFDRFSQADASSTRRYGGTGLGLAISKGLVELMGGEIRVESREGVGSIFSFTLPLTNHQKPKERTGRLT